jgi:hypothetical protein
MYPLAGEMAVSPAITRYTAKNINEGQAEDFFRDVYRSNVRAKNPADQGFTVVQLLRSLKDTELDSGRPEVNEELRAREHAWPRAIAYDDETGLAVGVGGTSPRQPSLAIKLNHAGFSVI